MRAGLRSVEHVLAFPPVDGTRVERRALFQKGATCTSMMLYRFAMSRSPSGATIWVAILSLKSGWDIVTVGVGPAFRSPCKSPRTCGVWYRVGRDFAPASGAG
jgi:hypothetical protein